MSPWIAATLRVGAGLGAGLLGGYVTQRVAESLEFLPAGAGAVAFWAVVVGGFYKGWAAAVRAERARHA